MSWQIGVRVESRVVLNVNALQTATAVTVNMFLLSQSIQNKRNKKNEANKRVWLCGEKGEWPMRPTKSSKKPGS